jgi:hypothetical protein
LKTFLWPDERQQLLLRAALGDGEAARAAFAAWRRTYDLGGRIDLGTYRLLPLAYDNLVRLGADDPVMARLRGVRRHSWCQGQLRLRHATAALDALAAARIPALVSKGLALAFAYHESLATRPMSDIDIVVAHDRCGDAVRVLVRAGWTAGARWRSHAEHDHAVALVSPTGEELDLHRALAWELMAPAIERRIWRDALPLQLGATATLRPSAAHLLLQTIIHGLQPNLVPPIRWIADSVTILRAGAAAIDWSELCALAEDAHLVLRLGAGLAYLHEHFAAPIPADVLRAVRAHKPGFAERLESRFLAGPRVASLEWDSWRDRTRRVARMLMPDRRADLPGFALAWVRRRIGARQVAR